MPQLLRRARVRCARDKFNPPRGTVLTVRQERFKSAIMGRTLGTGAMPDSQPGTKNSCLYQGSNGSLCRVAARRF